MLFLYNWVRTAHYSRLAQQAFSHLTPTDPSLGAAGPIEAVTILCVIKGEVGKLFGNGGKAFLRTNENKARSASQLVIRPID